MNSGLRICFIPFSICSDPIGISPLLGGAMNFIFLKQFTIASASAQVISFGRLFMSIPVSSSISFTLLLDILESELVNILLYLLLSVCLAINRISSALTPFGCGKTSFGSIGTIFAALLNMYLCPVGSLKVIFA